MIDLISKTAEELGVTNTAITNQKDILFYNVKQAPFSIHGLFDPLNTSPYRRIPESVAEATNDGVKSTAHLQSKANYDEAFLSYTLQL